MLTDPISDLLTQVRNGAKARQRKVDVPASQLKIAIVDIWKKAGFIRNFKLYRQDEKGILRIYLKYVGKNRSVIQGVRKVSKPSRRVYVAHNKMPKIMGGLGVSIVSTSKGIMTDEMAKESHVGGEILCTIW